MKPACFLIVVAWCATSFGFSTISRAQQVASSDFPAHAKQLREETLQKLSPPPKEPDGVRASAPSPWHDGIVTALFFIGERNGRNQSSAWDATWQKSYGGFDDPDPKARRKFIPSAFTPRLNPFYVALPYNDISTAGTKPEARIVIPWFGLTFEREGISVCKDRWVAIRKGDRVAYAQWSDCGPFRTDHFQYVFGNERPKPNPGLGVGLSVSPAVRDYLKLAITDITDWKFTEVRDVPEGPWRDYGRNNPFARRAQAP